MRLEAGTTKNGDGRVFPLTADLHRVLTAQQRVAETLQQQGVIVRRVFC